MNTEIAKVTIKSKKETMVQALRDCFDFVGQHDADLAKEVQFTIDNAKNASTLKSDIFETVQHVQALISTLHSTIGFQPTLFDSEETVDSNVDKEVNKPKKPVLKGTSKSSAKKPEGNSSTSVKKKETVENLKKPQGKKKENEVKVVPQMSGVSVAGLFPETLEIKVGDTPVKLKRAENYKSIDEIIKATEDEGKYLYFATYWTERLLKEYGYAYTNDVPEDKCEKFPNDLDILEMSLTCKFVKRVWAMSIYTDALFRFEDTDIKYTMDKNPYTGEQFKIRVANGMEFELYEEVEDANEDNESSEQE